MEQRTRQFIEGLTGLESRDEIVNVVNAEVDSYKQSFQQRGYRFNPERLPDEIAEGQRLMSRDRADIAYYEEIVHIKEGLSTGWVSKLYDLARFDEIRDQIEDILIEFE
jgi:hypothetical protein